MSGLDDINFDDHAEPQDQDVISKRDELKHKYARDLKEVKEKLAVLKSETSTLDKRKKELEANIINILDSMGEESFRSKELGLFRKVTRHNYKVDDPEVVKLITDELGISDTFFQEMAVKKQVTALCSSFEEKNKPLPAGLSDSPSEYISISK